MTNRSDVPRIVYEYNNAEHYYFPDIYIPHKKKLIEVKSTWTYSVKRDIIHKKAEQCMVEGYDFEIWIYEAKGNKEIITFTEPTPSPTAA